MPPQASQQHHLRDHNDVSGLGFDDAADWANSGVSHSPDLGLEDGNPFDGSSSHQQQPAPSTDSQRHSHQPKSDSGFEDSSISLPHANALPQRPGKQQQQQQQKQKQPPVDNGHMHWKQDASSPARLSQPAARLAPRPRPQPEESAAPPPRNGSPSASDSGSVFGSAYQVRIGRLSCASLPL